MINKLKIKGFQRHTNSELNFSEKINIIIGSSNTGKSAIVKALKWLNDNDPAGSEFINNNMDFCEVKSVFNDVDTIDKYKTEKEQKYIINGLELTAFGQNVPQEVKTITKLSPLNLQTQFDRFFLLQDSPGEVARTLNEIINLQIMDETIKKAKSKVNEVNRDIKYLDKDIILLKKELKSYDWIDSFNDKLTVLEEKNDKLQDLIADNNEIMAVYEEISALYDKIHIISKNLQNKPHISSLRQKLTDVLTLENDLYSLKQYFLSLQEIRSQLNLLQNTDKYKKKCDQLKKNVSLLNNKMIDNNQISDLYNQLKIIKINLFLYEKQVKSRKKIDFLNKKLKKYVFLKQKIDLLNDFSNLNNQINDLSVYIIKNKKKLQDLMPTICPLCKQKIKK